MIQSGPRRASSQQEASKPRWEHMKGSCGQCRDPLSEVPLHLPLHIWLRDVSLLRLWRWERAHFACWWPFLSICPTLPIRVCALFVVYPTDIFAVFSEIKPLGLGLDTTSVLSAINSVSGAKTDGFRDHRGRSHLASQCICRRSSK